MSREKSSQDAVACLGLAVPIRLHFLCFTAPVFYEHIRTRRCPAELGAVQRVSTPRHARALIACSPWRAVRPAVAQYAPRRAGFIGRRLEGAPLGKRLGGASLFPRRASRRRATYRSPAPARCWTRRTSRRRPSCGSRRASGTRPAARWCASRSPSCPSGLRSRARTSARGGSRCD